jgi:dihydropyrimidine dehydrogenase (NAD+) subunit PreA
MVDLSVNYCGFKVKNPLLAASATETKDWKTMKKAIDAGFGGVVVKSLYGNAISVSRKYYRPRFQLLNWHPRSSDPLKAPEGFILYSIEQGSPFSYREWVADVNKTKEVVGDQGMVIGSIMGTTLDDWEGILEAIEKGCHMDALELDLSCPHMKEVHAATGVELGADPDHAAELVRFAKKYIKVPVIGKLTPQTAVMVDVALKCQEAGLDGLSVHNRMMALDVDIEKAAPSVWPTYGGWGGPWMLQYTSAWISKLYQAVKIPISHTSGVWKWQDIIAVVMAGATTVQSCTAILVKGWDVVKEWLDNIEPWMEKKGYKSFEEMRGIVHKKMIPASQIPRNQPGVYAILDKKKCTACGWCPKICLYEAIQLKGKVLKIDPEKCDGCGMCSQVCPTKAIHMNQPA